MNVCFKSGDIFDSDAQALVNTVNTVGVMGKGVALGFKKRFPEMYADYVWRCEQHDVQLGRPYLYRSLIPPFVINFPTKGHWRSASRLGDIVNGLEYLSRQYEAWGVESIAFPALGCGNGGLDWHTVEPVMMRSLLAWRIPVQIYAPSAAAGRPERETFAA